MPYTWFKGNLFCRIQSPGRACFLKDGSSDKRVNIAQNWYVFVESSTELQKCVGDIQLFAFTEMENNLPKHHFKTLWRYKALPLSFSKENKEVIAFKNKSYRRNHR